MRLSEVQESVEDLASREAVFSHLERNVNDFRGNWEKFSDISYQFSPESGCTVQVPFKFVDNEAVTTKSAEPDNRITEVLLVGEAACYFWHPDTVSPFNDPEDGVLDVLPTSSTRTLQTTGLPYNFFIKTHLPKRHFLYDRSLKPSVVSHSIDVSHDIERLTSESTDESWAFMPESLAFILEGSGVIFREREPRPHVQQPRLLLPAFSLYSKDTKNPDDPSLLSQLIHHNGEDDPLQYMLDKIVTPLRSVWLEILRKRGLLLELHAQNALFELNNSGDVERVVLRDFQSIWSDIDIREKNNLPQMSRDGFLPEERNKQYSLCYDHFMGTMFLRHLVNVFLQEFDQYHAEEVNKIIAQDFRTIAPDIIESMSEVETFRMAHGPHQISGQGPVPSGSPPVYR